MRMRTMVRIMVRIMGSVLMAATLIVASWLGLSVRWQR